MEEPLFILHWVYKTISMTGKYVVSIEDNSSDLLLMKRIFDKEIKDCDLQHIGDGENAIEILETEDYKLNPPSLILLDIKLPKKNGLEVLRFIRSVKIYDNVPVVILSSSDIPEEIQKAYKLGVNSFVEKPKNYPEFRRQLPAIVNFWLKFNIS